MMTILCKCWMQHNKVINLLKSSSLLGFCLFFCFYSVGNSHQRCVNAFRSQVLQKKKNTIYTATTSRQAYEYKKVPFWQKIKKGKKKSKKNTMNAFSWSGSNNVYQAASLTSLKFLCVFVRATKGLFLTETKIIGGQKTVVENKY